MTKLITYQKVLRYHDHDGLKKLLLLLLTTKNFRNSHLLAGKRFIFLKKSLDEALKSFNAKFGFL